MDRKKTTKVKVIGYLGKPLFGYWKKKKIAFSTSYELDTESNDFIDIEINAENPIKLIDLYITKLSELKEICEYNNISFFMLMGIDPMNEEITKILPNDTLSKAIEYFITFKSSATSTVQYKRIFKDLIDQEILNPNMRVEEYLKEQTVGKRLLLDPSKNARIEEYLVSLTEKNETQKASPSLESSRKIQNIIKSFHKYLRGENPYKIKKQRYSFQEIEGKWVQIHDPFKLKYRANINGVLQPFESETFFNALNKINPVHELLARMLWYYNYEMYFDNSQAPIITLELLLKTKIDDLDHEKNIISIRSNTTNFRGLYCFYLPEILFQRIQILAINTDLFLFRNKFGAPINERQIWKSFKMASEYANFKRTITPFHLR